MATTLLFLSGVTFLARMLGSKPDDDDSTTSYMENVTKIAVETPEDDPTGFLLEGVVPTFLLMHGPYLKYICMLAYTFLHGYKLFKTLDKDTSFAYKFVRMIFQCTGGGLLVPIFINAIPVSLGNDAYPICIFISTILHIYVPALTNLVSSFPLVKAALIILYETQRASVVVKLTKAAAAAIPPSEFDGIALFGPIFCGAIAGCGGAFLPFTKGLTPIEKGLADNMSTAFMAAACFHLFYHTSLSDNIAFAAQKGQVMVAFFFISHSLKQEKLGIATFLGFKKSAEASKAKDGKGVKSDEVKVEAVDDESSKDKKQ